MMKNLIIAPHFDDEILGAGGTMAKYIGKQEFYVCIVTNGYLGKPELYSKEHVKNLIKTSEKIKKLIKIKKYYNLNFPATKLDNIPISLISDSILKIINVIKPNRVFVPSKSDMHIDHRRIFEASLVSLRPINSHIVKMILSYEVLSETEWGSELGQTFKPNYFEKISERNLELKLRLFKLYNTEIKKFPHPRSVEGIRNQSALRGQFINHNFAEAFEIIREIK